MICTRTPPLSHRFNTASPQVTANHMAGPESLASPPEQNTSTKVNVYAHAAKLGLKSKQVCVFVHLSGHELNFWLQIPEIIMTFCVTRTQRRWAKIARVWVKWCLGPWQRQEIPGDVFNKAGQRRRPEDQRLKTYWSGALCQKSGAAIGCWLSEFDQEWDMHILQVDWWKKKKSARGIFLNVPKQKCAKCAYFSFVAIICSSANLSWGNQNSPALTHI